MNFKHLINHLFKTMFKSTFFRNIMFVGTTVTTYLIFKNIFDTNHNIKKQTLNIQCDDGSNIQNQHLENQHLQNQHLINPHIKNIKKLSSIEAHEYIKKHDLKNDIEIINTYLELFSEKFDIELINYLKINNLNLLNGFCEKNIDVLLYCLKNNITNYDYYDFTHSYPFLPRISTLSTALIKPTEQTGENDMIIHRKIIEIIEYQLPNHHKSIENFINQYLAIVFTKNTTKNLNHEICTDILKFMMENNFKIDEKYHHENNILLRWLKTETNDEIDKLFVDLYDFGEFNSILFINIHNFEQINSSMELKIPIYYQIICQKKCDLIRTKLATR